MFKFKKILKKKKINIFGNLLHVSDGSLTSPKEKEEINGRLLREGQGYKTDRLSLRCTTKPKIETRLPISTDNQHYF